MGRNRIGSFVKTEKQEIRAAGDRLPRDKLNPSLCVWQTEVELWESGKDRQGARVLAGVPLTKAECWELFPGDSRSSPDPDF